MSDSDIFDRADALMRRNRPFVAGQSDDAAPAAEDMEVPELNEIVDADAAEGSAKPVDAIANAIEYHLRAELEARFKPVPQAIENHIRTWLSEALPQIVRAELDVVGDRIAQQALAELRNELMPLLHELIEHPRTEADTEPPAA
ncbi:MAG: hypothetical protein KF778_03490 [Rhodocyclaceae bacterium]|nr:hypothetical protein [Rhodocyclaceae bacterium]MBX3667442.1 hypothetical protein [Rhodocyclaceae bacterium]